MNLPKHTQSKKKGRDGLNIVTKIVEKEFDWIVRPNHQEDDYGIDAYIDITIDGYVTGKSIAIQIKSGESYLKELNNDFWSFIGEKKHLNYYLNHDTPVLIVLVDLDKEIAYWEVCKIEYISLNETSWSMPVPKNQQINIHQKDELLKYISKNVDYVSQLEQYWNDNKSLSEYARICIFAGKEDIEQMNYQPLIDLIERICANKLHLSRYKANVEIGIHGYDYDERELYQIDEVKNWAINIFKNVPGLSYFLVNDANAQFLKLFLFSMITIVKSSSQLENRRFYIEYESKELEKVFNILFADLNDFTEAFKIDQEINKQMSFSIAECITGDEIPFK
ncbi:DUF4365 domain-containing protein [Parabacteroides sp. Marseille-P3160]|uniref:DUF4365 domain-containing protein n=1 Tax=Parabacteroides sp. Marseille-P3160 TaxID=1917887 RepID=UPI0009B992B8|nr:DUF4365 domain-containing protein [Parabacteroides sp. Marseille-P3160]